MRIARVFLVTLLLAALAAACGSSDNKSSSSTITTTSSSTPGTSTSETATTTQAGGSTTPVSVAVTHPAAHLVAVRAARQETVDRVVFEFSDRVPGYKVAYTNKPIMGTSGKEIPLGGSAALLVLQPGHRPADLQRPQAGATRRHACGEGGRAGGGLRGGVELGSRHAGRAPVPGQHADVPATARDRYP